MLHINNAERQYILRQKQIFMCCTVLIHSKNEAIFQVFLERAHPAFLTTYVVVVLVI